MSDFIAGLVIATAQRHNFTPEQTIACLSTGIQESNLDNNAIGGGGAWHGVYQQDEGYPNRDDPQGNINGFFDRLVAKLNSPGASPDIWKNIFWLQQRPSEPSADQAFSNGRQAYLTEIQSRIQQATNIYNALATNVKPLVPQVHTDVAITEFKKYLGDDYVYGGTGPGGYNPGFDCSGLVLFILYCAVKGTPEGFVREGSTLSWVPGNGPGPFGTQQVSGPHAFPADAAITIAIHHEGGGEADHMNCSVMGYGLMESSGDHGVCNANSGAIPQDNSYWTDWWYLAGGQEDDMFSDQDRKWLLELHGALFNSIPSQSPFRHLGEGAVLQQHQMPINDDGFEHPQFVEWAASRGDARELALLIEVANGDPNQYPDRAQDIALAKVVLARVMSSDASLPVTQPIPTPPAPAVEPAHIPGVNKIGPSGWVAIGGISLNGAIYALQQATNAMPTDWANAVMAFISLLTVLGVYRAPNVVAKIQGSQQDSAPIPSPLPSGVELTGKPIPGFPTPETVAPQHIIKETPVGVTIEVPEPVPTSRSNAESETVADALKAMKDAEAHVIERVEKIQKATE